MAAAYLELLIQMTVGANLVLPRASLVADWNSGTSAFDILHQEEAWNVDHVQPHPVIARTSTGVYTYQFDATYNDLSGLAVNTALSAARCTHSEVGGGCTAEAWVDASDATLVHIETKDGGSAADIRFWLEVL
jgi:hypothetical protein